MATPTSSRSFIRFRSPLAALEARLADAEGLRPGAHRTDRPACCAGRWLRRPASCQPHQPQLGSPKDSRYGWMRNGAQVSGLAGAGQTSQPDHHGFWPRYKDRVDFDTSSACQGGFWDRRRAKQIMPAPTVALVVRSTWPVTVTVPDTGGLQSEAAILAGA